MSENQKEISRLRHQVELLIKDKEIAENYVCIVIEEKGELDKEVADLTRQRDELLSLLKRAKRAMKDFGPYHSEYDKCLESIQRTLDKHKQRTPEAPAGAKEGR